MKTLILNDLHLGVQRASGTTPASSEALRAWQQQGYSEILSKLSPDHLIINGDLLDGFTIDTRDLIEAYKLLCQHLDTGGRLTLIQGNHDSNRRGTRLSSFHLLCHFLQSRAGANVTVIDQELTEIDAQLVAIPHMPNQELFNLELDKAAGMDGHGRYLLLHCNVKNTFAEHSDHSLNLSNDHLGKLMVAGWTLVIGHEHQGYDLREGRVIVTGNQLPTSISDCIGDKSKQALLLEDGKIRPVTVWAALGSYQEVPWQEVDNVLPDAQFVRITGEATAAESAEVVKAIASLRQRHNAFVISNAVKVEGAVSVEELASKTVEDIKAFDVLSLILEHCTEDEAKVIKELLQ